MTERYYLNPCHADAAEALRSAHVRKTGDEVKAKVERRMATIDSLTPELRNLVHEFGWRLVKDFMERGVTSARDIRVLIEAVLHELSPIGGGKRLVNSKLKD